MVYDIAHSAELFIKFAALHAGILFPFVVREKAIAERGRERLCRGKHAALHHQLCETYASQKNRFTAAVGAGDDQEVFIVSIRIIADNLSFHA